jgi:NAD(P)-dependent dehydrogenase (short-subunit alcohol dehydrogenase family)
MDIPHTTAYSVSKAGLIRFVGCLQLELKETKIQTFVLHPGEVGNTKLADVSYVTKDYVREQVPEIPMMIGGMLKTILNCHTRLPAWTCVFLATGKVIIWVSR